MTNIPIKKLLIQFSFNNIYAQCDYATFSYQTQTFINKKSIQEVNVGSGLLDLIEENKTIFRPIIIPNFQGQLFQSYSESFDTTITDSNGEKADISIPYTLLYQKIIQSLLDKVAPQFAFYYVTVCLSHSASKQSNALILSAIQNQLVQRQFKYYLNVVQVRDLFMSPKHAFILVQKEQSEIYASEVAESLGFGSNLVPLAVMKMVKKYFSDEIYQIVFQDFGSILQQQVIQFKNKLTFTIQQKKINTLIQMNLMTKFQQECQQNSLFSLESNNFTLTGCCLQAAQREFIRWFSDIVIPTLKPGIEVWVEEFGTQFIDYNLLAQQVKSQFPLFKLSAVTNTRLQDLLIKYVANITSEVVEKQCVDVVNYMNNLKAEAERELERSMVKSQSKKSAYSEMVKTNRQSETLEVIKEMQLKGMGMQPLYEPIEGVEEMRAFVLSGQKEE